LSDHLSPGRAHDTEILSLARVRDAFKALRDSEHAARQQRARAELRKASSPSGNAEQS
jgi:hypothetical protein